MQQNLSDWLTKTQVAEALGVSTKTVEKLAENNVLQKQTWRRPGKPAIAVYHPDDVDRERKKRSPDAEPFVVPASAAEQPNPSTELIKTPALAAEVFMATLSEVMRRPQDSIRLVDQHYLTLQQASELSGLSQAFLMRKIKSLELTAIKDVSWKIKRSELEKL